jgi:hypothetical protein
MNSHTFQIRHQYQRTILERTTCFCIARNQTKIICCNIFTLTNIFNVVLQHKFSNNGLNLVCNIERYWLCPMMAWSFSNLLFHHIISNKNTWIKYGVHDRHQKNSYFSRNYAYNRWVGLLMTIKSLVIKDNLSGYTSHGSGWMANNQRFENHHHCYHQDNKDGDSSQNVGLFTV